MWYTDDGAAIEVEEDDHNWKVSIDHFKQDAFAKNIKTSTRTFKQKCKDPSCGLSLFGTVPPPQKLSIEQVTSIATSVSESIKALQPDAVVVYDIQDERSRDGSARPFPFLGTHEPRLYAQLIEQKVPGCEALIFKAMTPGQSSQDFSEWLNETVEQYNGKHLVLVGGCTKPGENILSVLDAAKIIGEKQSQVSIGGIVIPERHRDRGNEHQRLIEKVDTGVSFFTSQVVYNADNSIWLLRDYDELCKQQNKQPARLVFTFAPFGSECTVKFLRWLGVELPDGTVKRVLSRPSLKARVEESVEICWENWKRILDASKRLKINVPIGFSVENVSKSKAEQDAAVELFSMLKEEMETHFANLKHKL